MFKLEKEQNGEQAIVIDGWSNGIAVDPYSGLGTMLSPNLAVPGEVSSGYTSTSSVITTPGALTLNWPIHRAIHEVAGVAVGYFILDSASQVWTTTTYNGTWSFLSTSNTVTGATLTNQGLCYFIPRSGGAGYLFKFRDSHIDYLVAGAGTWVSNWDPSNGTTTSAAVIVAGVNHFAIEGQDSVMYFCNGAGIGKIMEIDGQIFDPTNPATYTFIAYNGTPPEVQGNENAVAIASYDRAQSIAEQGANLLIGGSLNVIYPWDRQSPQVAYPLYIGDTFIDRMVTVNTNVYIFAGGATSRGRIYVTNGSQANLFFKIPDYITGQQEPYFTWGDAIYHRNNLVFSFFMMKNGGGYIPADASFFSTSQTWAVDLSVNIYGTPTETGFRSISRMGAASAIGRAGVLLPALQTSPGFSIIIGVQDSQTTTTASIEYLGTTSGIGRFYVTTDLIPVGTILQKKTFSQIEFKLRSPLEAGESITIVPIADGVQQTQLVNSTVGTISDVFTITFEKIQWLSFLIVGIGNSATSGVRLFQIRIR